MKRSLCHTALCAAVVLLLRLDPLWAAGAPPEQGPLAWPAITRECRPWAYHWWLGVSWRVFHDINFVNVAYRPFDASEWPVLPSGLLGPVGLFRAAPSG